MKIIHSLFIPLSILAVACSDSTMIGSDGYDDDGKIEVILPVVSTNSSSSSRTELDPDDSDVVRWSVGDEVALWADGADDASTALIGEKFTLRYFSTDFTNAEFSARISPMSETQEYKYSAFYPYPTTISGRDITYEIPSAQSGDYDGTIDFRVAKEVTGMALSSSTTDGCELSFKSIVHILKITIPSGYNDSGIPITELRVTLPFDAAGTSSFDMSNNDLSSTDQFPTITENGAQKITLSLNTPLEAGDGEYAWLFMNPAANVTGDIIIQGIGERSGEVVFFEEYAIPISNHTFNPGRITPVNTSIGAEIVPSTVLKFSIGENYLGEDINSFTVTAPSGANFVESGTNVMTFSIDPSNKYSMSYETPDKSLFGSELTVRFISDHAYVEESLSLSSVVDNVDNTLETKDVPHLLFENFDSISTNSSKDNLGVGGTDSDYGSDSPAVELSSSGWDLDTSGWYGTRIGSSASTAVRICARYESALGIASRYLGRLVAPPLSGITSAVRVKVTYNYKAGSYVSFSSSGGVTTYSHGSTTTTGGIKGSNYNDDGNNDKNYSGTSFTSITTDNSNSCSYDIESQTYNNIENNTNSYYISAATSATRPAWRVSTTLTTSKLAANANFWLYLDNITVTIDPE